MSAETISVFIVAENRLLREALSRLLTKRSDIRVAGACAFSAQVVEHLMASGPDVLLCDSSVAGLSSLQLIQEVRAAVPGVRVVLIGMEEDASIFLQAVRDGAVGYVLKEASAVELAAAVRSVANGEAVCPPALCRVLFEQYAGKQAQQPNRFRLRHDLGLTRREQQLVELIDRGLTNKEIASELNLSEQTIKNHVHRMLRKLGAADRSSAVALCRLPGVVS